MHLKRPARPFAAVDRSLNGDYGIKRCIIPIVNHKRGQNRRHYSKAIRKGRPAPAEHSNIVIHRVAAVVAEKKKQLMKNNNRECDMHDKGGVN
jgi:hypothetical protein